MFKENCIFYLVLLSCIVFSIDAYPSAEISETGEAPYIVELFDGTSRTRKTNNETHFTHCNGGIIGEQFILTSASCVMNENYQFFRTIFSVQSANTFYYLNDGKDIEGFYVPRTYNATTLRDNIAVLKLRNPLKIKENGFKQLEISHDTVKVDTKAEMTTGRLSYVVYPSFADKDFFNITVAIKIIRNTECRKIHRDLVEKSTLCAKFDGMSRPKSTRYASRGSVAVVDGKILVGLLSRERDLSKDTDDVQMYTDVSSQVNFIRNAMNNKTENMYGRIYQWPLGFLEMHPVLGYHDFVNN